ncbi:Nucleolar complex protein [Spatholobus suberectus]|nr:Nucleolar complex protein [Spatholobus suberectus]
MELSFIPLVRLRSFCKSTKVERFRKETRQLIRQIEASSDYVNGKRIVLVGEESSKFGNEVSESDEEDARKNKEGAAVFSSSWLPGNDSKIKQPTETKRKRKKQQKEKAIDDDVVEDLVLQAIALLLGKMTT